MRRKSLLYGSWPRQTHRDVERAACSRKSTCSQEEKESIFKELRGALQNFCLPSSWRGELNNAFASRGVLSSASGVWFGCERVTEVWECVSETQGMCLVMKTGLYVAF